MEITVHLKTKEKFLHLIKEEDSEILLETVTASIMTNTQAFNCTMGFLEFARLMLSNAKINKCSSVSLKGIEKAFELLPQLVKPPQREFNKTPFCTGGLALSSHAVIGHGYPDQTTSLIKEVMAPFEEMLSTKHGIGPIKSTNIIWALFACHNHKLKELLQECQNYPLHLKDIVNNSETIAFTEKDILGLRFSVSSDEWVSFKKLFCLSPTSINHLDHDELKQYPIFNFTDKRLLLWNFSHSLNCLWDLFEKSLNRIERFNKLRCKWLENRTADAFEKVFEPTKVFRKVSYPDPEKPNSTAELDVLIHWGNTLICTEAKAGQIDWNSIALKLKNSESTKPNKKRIRKHLTKVIREAWRQGERAEKYFTNSEKPIFSIKSETGTNNIEIDKPLRIILLAITLKPLHSLICDVSPLKKFGVIRETDYPIISNIFDFEIILERCHKQPEILLSYLIEKSNLVCSPAHIHTTDELDFFDSWNLGLFDGELHDEGNLILIDDFQNSFNEENQKAKLNLPIGIQNIISSLKSDEDPICHFIATELVQFGLDALHQLHKKLLEFKTTQLEPEQARVVSIMKENKLLMAVCVNDMPLENVEKHLLFYLDEKAKDLKPDIIVSFAVCPEDPFFPKKTAYMKR